MEKEKITYIAPGMLEWQMCVKVGKALVRVCFSGGFMGSNGLVPARCSTSDKALQRIIEESAQFRAGRVRRLNWSD